MFEDPNLLVTTVFNVLCLSIAFGIFKLLNRFVLKFPAPKEKKVLRFVLITVFVCLLVFGACIRLRNAGNL